MGNEIGRQQQVGHVVVSWHGDRDVAHEIVPGVACLDHQPLDPNPATDAAIVDETIAAVRVGSGQFDDDVRKAEKSLSGQDALSQRMTRAHHDGLRDVEQRVPVDVSRQALEPADDQVEPTTVEMLGGILPAMRKHHQTNARSFLQKHAHQFG